jgi:hypothetical protein
MKNKQKKYNSEKRQRNTKNGTTKIKSVSGLDNYIFSHFFCDHHLPLVIKWLEQLRVKCTVS